MPQSWTYNHLLGKLNLKQGNTAKAYRFGLQCKTIINNSFAPSTPLQKIKLVDHYYKTIILLKSCSESQKCNHCVEKQLLEGFNSLSKLLKMTSTKDLKHKVIEVLNRLSDEIECFYGSNDMAYENSVFQNNLKSAVFKSIQKSKLHIVH